MGEMLLEASHTNVKYVQHLADGFAVTGEIDTGNLGEPIPGGTRSNRRPGLGGPPELSTLRQECRSINEATLKRAHSRLQEEARDPELVQEAWRKF